MSCMMSDPRLICCIADSLEHILNCTFEATGMTVPESLLCSLEDCRDGFRFYSASKIFEKLYRLNSAAYYGRYPNDGRFLGEVPEKPEQRMNLLRYVETEQATGTRGYRYVVQPGHYKLLSSLDFFVYQCEEDATREKELQRGLREFDVALALWIVRNSVEYTELKWGQPWE